MDSDKKALVVQQPKYQIADIRAMAEAVAKSKMFGMKTVEEAMALMLISDAEGLHPAIAARDYHIIQGRPTLKADAMLARFQTAGGTVRWIEYTDKKVSAEFSHPQGGSVVVTWTMEMAVNAQLTKNPTWKQYPRQMLRARTVSEGIRTVFPGVVVGCYTPEEIEDADQQQRPEPAKQQKQQHRTVDAEVIHEQPKQEKTQRQLTESQVKYFPRIKDALDYLFGDDVQKKMEECAALSEFQGKDGKMVEGMADYRKLDGERLQILAHKLEATVKNAKKMAEKEQQAAEPKTCEKCASLLDENGGCTNPDCIPF